MHFSSEISQGISNMGCKPTSGVPFLPLPSPTLFCPPLSFSVLSFAELGLAILCILCPVRWTGQFAELGLVLTIEKNRFLPPIIDFQRQTILTSLISSSENYFKTLTNNSRLPLREYAFATVLEILRQIWLFTYYSLGHFLHTIINTVDIEFYKMSIPFQENK